MHARIDVCVCVCARARACVHACVHACVRACVCVCRACAQDCEIPQDDDQELKGLKEKVPCLRLIPNP